MAQLPNPLLELKTHDIISKNNLKPERMHSSITFKLLINDTTVLLLVIWVVAEIISFPIALKHFFISCTASLVEDTATFFRYRDEVGFGAAFRICRWSDVVLA